MRQRLAFAVPLLFVFLCSAPRAQVTWTKQGDITARQGHAMVYDAARQRVVAFGGEFVLRPFDDTWEWDGASWSLQQTANRPAARNGHAMAYDSRRQRVVLFGGTDGAAPFGDTWEYEASSARVSVALSRKVRNRGAGVD